MCLVVERVKKKKSASKCQKNDRKKKREEGGLLLAKMNRSPRHVVCLDCEQWCQRCLIYGHMLQQTPSGRSACLGQAPVCRQTDRQTNERTTNSRAERVHFTAAPISLRDQKCNSFVCELSRTCVLSEYEVYSLIRVLHEAPTVTLTLRINEVQPLKGFTADRQTAVLNAKPKRITFQGFPGMFPLPYCKVIIRGITAGTRPSVNIYGRRIDFVFFLLSNTSNQHLDDFKTKRDFCGLGNHDLLARTKEATSRQVLHTSTICGQTRRGHTPLSLFGQP